MKFGMQRTSSKGGFFGEVNKGLGNIGVVRNEALVKIGKAEE